MNSKLLQQIYQQYAKEIFLYLVSICHNTQMAEDLMQEVFLKAMLTLKENHTNFRAWLYKVARNLCINELKKAKRIEYIDDLTNEKTDINKINCELSMIEQVLSNERSKALYNAILTLPPRQREILTMHYIGEISQTEIAKILHLTPENVRILSHRARKSCKKILEEKGYEI